MLELLPGAASRSVNASSEGNMTDQIKVLVVDDEPIIRDGLTKILDYEPDITVVGDADGTSAIEMAVATQPDVILLDIFMPSISGLDLMPQIKEKLPNCRLLVLTVSDNEGDLYSSLRLGAQGYLLKSTPVERIIDGVRKVAAGETVLSHQMVGKLASDIQHKGEERRLSARESQILEFLREGLTNAQIARRLSVEESTVKTHVHHLLGKLRIKNRTEVTLFPRRHIR